jgi:hypothetical protein
MLYNEVARRLCGSIPYNTPYESLIRKRSASIPNSLGSNMSFAPCEKNQDHLLLYNHFKLVLLALQYRTMTRYLGEPTNY